MQVLQIQYVTLLRRIRDAPRRAPHACRDWWQVLGYTVEPVRSFPSVLWFVKQWASERHHAPAGRLGEAMLARVASLVSAHLGAGLLRRQCSDTADGLGPQGNGLGPRSFFVSNKGLALCGFSWAGRKRQLRRMTQRKWLYKPSPGGVATLLLPGNGFGKIVYVRKQERELDISAVSASVDRERFLFFRAVKLENQGPLLQFMHGAR